MKLAIFYHNYQLNNHPNIPIEYWHMMYEDQMRSLATSGLLSACEFIHIGINGELVPEWTPKANVVLHPRSEWSMGETATLKAIRDFCSKEESQDYKILYIHQKGLKDITNLASRHWRLMMEYFTIHRWKDCVEHLDEYDCVGVNWLTDTFVGRKPHFSGNFWWATARHINTLDHSYLENQPNLSPLINVLNKEFWIGSNPATKAKEIHCSNLGEAGHYSKLYSARNYITI
jgi:hypothetical protein